MGARPRQGKGSELIGAFPLLLPPSLCLVFFSPPLFPSPPPLPSCRSMQIAHWKAHGTVPCTYESASTAAYKHGRTETIRPLTPESATMCRLFSPGSTASAVEKYNAMKQATVVHRKITTECMMGKGVDRHLFALQKWAQKQGLASPAIFSDPAYASFKDIRLSTSTLASPALAGGGFGPVSRSSYGVGYGIEERGAHFHVMNYKRRQGAAAGAEDETKGTNSKAFIEGLESALKEITECIAAAKKAGAIEEKK